MRRSTIAVFSLLLMPCSVLACYDEHKAGWFKEMPARSWEVPGASREGNPVGGDVRPVGHRRRYGRPGLDRGLVPGLFPRQDKDRMHPVPMATPPPLALPFDWPRDRTIRVDPGHQPGGQPESSGGGRHS